MAVSFVNFSVYGRGAKGLSVVSVLLGLTRILFTIAHTSGLPNWPDVCRPSELLRTDSAQGRCQYDWMREKRK
jgi:hypothetical protein